MNFITIKKIPTAEEIIQQFPLSEDGIRRVSRDRQEVKDILAGRDKRMMIVMGPCSAWPYNATMEYARRLKRLSEKVNDKLKLVLRLYIQKPRTKKGWTGPVNQPNPFVGPDIEEGIKYCRSLMVNAVEMGLPIADEALFTHNAKGFLELLSWVAIGARSVEDQEHRIFASSIECAVGLKNTITGAIEPAVNGMVAAQSKHTAVFLGYQVETLGNQYAHLVLRGGTVGSNYNVESLRQAKELMEKNEVNNPAILVDCSHDNCCFIGVKDYKRQMVVAHEVLEILSGNPDLRKLIKGFMLESFIKGGKQKLDSLTAETIDPGGLSITDPCLGWEDTEKLVLEIAERL